MVASRFILPSDARRTAGRIFDLAGVAWSGVEQLPDSSHFMSVRPAYFWQTRRRRGGRDRHEEPAVVRETRRIPAGASTFAPSSSGWYMDVLPRRSGSSIHAVIWESHRAYIRQNC